MNKVRIGILGMGNMGKFHADYLLANKVSRAEVTCFSEPSGLSRERYKQLNYFDSAEKLIRSGQVDAVIIATPHYSHTTLGIDALEHGLHVLVEKPISVHKADCERLIAAAKKRKQVFAAMFQLRTEPKYRKLKSLLDARELGQLTRVNWIITDWFRPNAYYASGGWRATWKGEGGGVLINQCPHNLDLMLWVTGLQPKRVTAVGFVGKTHPIEVEDEVSAFVEYGNGAIGHFITTTGEAPGTNRLEIVGDRGKMVIENGKLLWSRTRKSVKETRETIKEAFHRLETWEIDLTPTAPKDPENLHRAIVENFAKAILKDEPM